MGKVYKEKREVIEGRKVYECLSIVAIYTSIVYISSSNTSKTYIIDMHAVRLCGALLQKTKSSFQALSPALLIKNRCSSSYHILE